MKKSVICIFACVVMILSSTAVFGEPDVEKSLRENFADLAFEKVTPSPVAGLYEVTAAQRIYYYAPKENIIFVNAQMFDNTKRNLTALRMQELRAIHEREMLAKAKDLPLDKAVKIGSGTHTVIEFTAPDCPYCRRAAEFFDKRTDVTKYTFFMPLSSSPDASRKIRYILCQKDRGKAFEEVMKGKHDDGKYEICADAEVDNLMKIHQSESARMGISGTPFFIINGEAVTGADIPKLERLLAKDSGKK